MTSLHAGSHANRLEQGSLCLPVFLARKLQESGRDISNSLLATGSVSNGKVEDSHRIRRYKLKLELSQKLHDGILSPGEVSMDEKLHLPLPLAPGLMKYLARLKKN